MVYLRNLIIFLYAVATISVFITSIEAAMNSKFTYKKPIYGKTNFLKDKRYKMKVEPKKTTTTTTTSTATTPLVESTTTEMTTTSLPITITIRNTPLTNELSSEEILMPDYLQSTSTESADTTDIGYSSQEITEDDAYEKTVEEIAIEPPIVDNTYEEPTIQFPPSTTTTLPPPTTLSNQPVPCTCGVFLASQLRRGSSDLPAGDPVIVSEVEQTFPCTLIGQKQCQSKCLQTLVQHLPKSASILCASVNGDIFKERAHLFVKNCRNQWWNTNLTAGREYCCRNGLNYPCPN